MIEFGAYRSGQTASSNATGLQGFAKERFAARGPPSSECDLPQWVRQSSSQQAFYDVNSTRCLGAVRRRDYEALVRKILQYPKRPAVVALYWFSTGTRHRFYENSQDDMDVIAR